MQGSKDGFAEATSPLCFNGSKAAAAARSAKPLDLMIVANRLDAGKFNPRLRSLWSSMSSHSPHNTQRHT